MFESVKVLVLFYDRFRPRLEFLLANPGSTWTPFILGIKAVLHRASRPVSLGYYLKIPKLGCRWNQRQYFFSPSSNHSTYSHVLSAELFSYVSCIAQSYIGVHESFDMKTVT